MSENADRIFMPVVRSGGVVHTLRNSGGTVFTFGRAKTCTVCLDSNDLAISRLAGTIEHDGSAWWVVNNSSRRPLVVVDEFGFRSLVPPGRRYALEGRVRVVVDGSTARHELDVTGPPIPSRQGVSAPGEPTAVGEEVLITAEDRAALTALFAGYLEDGPGYSPRPRTYAAAAARLGWPSSKVRKKIEYLRFRLEKAGVPHLTDLPSLAEYVIANGTITRNDLRLLYPGR